MHGFGPGSVGASGGGSTDARYLTRTDPGPTLDAIAAGIDPYADPVPDDFECHAFDDPDFSAPDVTVSMGRGAYEAGSDGGEVRRIDGTDAGQAFAGGPLDGETTVMAFDWYGQHFDIAAQGRSFRCFQRGASAERAVTRFELGTPDTGDYACIDLTSGESAPLRLAASGGTGGDADGGGGGNGGGSYAIGNGTGEYRVSGAIESPGSTIEFVDGPLGGRYAAYSEVADTGYRSFTIVTTTTVVSLGSGGSSSSLTLLCESVGEPLAYQGVRRHAGARPRPPGGAVVRHLVRPDRASSTTSVHDYASYVTFDLAGYAWRGEPNHPGVDCARTCPNGLPYCEAYEFDGSVVRFSSPLGTLDYDDGLRLHFYVGMTIGGKVAFDGFLYLPE